jgi:hypothetical protein
MVRRRDALVIAAALLAALLAIVAAGLTLTAAHDALVSLVGRDGR